MWCAMLQMRVPTIVVITQTVRSKYRMRDWPTMHGWNIYVLSDLCLAFRIIRFTGSA